MLDRHQKIGASLVFALLAAAPLQAQESPWGINVFAFGGENVPLRNLGKNAVEVQQLSAIQVVAQLENSASLGGGLEFLFLNHDLKIRGQFSTTVGAAAKGVLGLCESGELAAPGVGLCAVKIETDARIIDGSAELVLFAGERNRRVRPTISLGLGVRSFGFGSDDLDCGEFGNELDDAFQVCRKSKEILENPSVNPTLTFGVGLEALRGPVAVFLRAYTVTGSYSGGSGLADGGRQMDLVLTGGLAFRIR